MPCTYPYPAVAATVDLPGLFPGKPTGDSWFPWAGLPNLTRTSEATNNPPSWCFLGDAFGDGYAYFGIAATYHHTGQTSIVGVITMRVSGATVEFSSLAVVRDDLGASYSVSKPLPCAPVGNEVLCVVGAGAVFSTTLGTRQYYVVRFLCGSTFGTPVVVTSATSALYERTTGNAATEVDSQPFLVITTGDTPLLLVMYTLDRVRTYAFDGSGFLTSATPSHPASGTQRFTAGTYAFATTEFPDAVPVFDFRPISQNYVLAYTDYLGHAPSGRFLRVMRFGPSGYSVGTAFNVTTLLVPTPGVYLFLPFVQRVCSPELLDFVWLPATPHTPTRTLTITTTHPTRTEMSWYQVIVDTSTLVLFVDETRELRGVCTSWWHGVGARTLFLATTSGEYALMQGGTFHTNPLFTKGGAMIASLGGSGLFGVIGPGTTSLTISTRQPGFAAGSYFYLRSPSGTAIQVVQPSTLSRPCCFPPEITDINPDRGPTRGGTAVTITGRYLTGTSEVLFGTNPATTLAYTPTSGSISLKTPSHPVGAVRVFITSVNGTDTDPTAFTYYLTPGWAVGSVHQGIEGWAVGVG